MTESGCRRFEGKVAVVTGGGRGIGLATVRRLAMEGASVVVADINHDAAKSGAEEVDGLPVCADVSNVSDVERMYRVAHEAYGGIDIAFNNAGIAPPEDDSILTTGLDAWRRVQEVNLTSVYLCCQAVIPYMQRAGKGSIINTASFVAVLGSATSQISYTASKGGVLALSRELGVQFAREGIRVNALCPGPSIHHFYKSFSQRIRNEQHDGWSMSRSGVSPSPRRLLQRSRSWPVTTRPSSRPRRSSLTAGSRARM